MPDKSGLCTSELLSRASYLILSRHVIDAFFHVFFEPISILYVKVLSGTVSCNSMINLKLLFFKSGIKRPIREPELNKFQKSLICKTRLLSEVEDILVIRS